MGASVDGGCRDVQIESRKKCDGKRSRKRGAVKVRWRDRLKASTIRIEATLRLNGRGQRSCFHPAWRKPKLGSNAAKQLVMDE